jgi:hypothetical protein
MNLSQILIKSGVTPNHLHPDCKFIAQDGDDGILAEYSKMPLLSKHHKKMWLIDFMVPNQSLPYIPVISEDWQTPLSREQFTADYEEYKKRKYYEIAVKAIQGIFADKSLSSSEAKEKLEELVSMIESFIDCLDGK